MEIVEAICQEFQCEESEVFFHDETTFEVSNQEGSFQLIELPFEDQQDHRYAYFKVS